MANNAYIGIDMGATHTRICIMDEAGHTVTSDKYVTNQILAPDMNQGLLTLIKSKMDTYDLTLQRVVLGLPATISKDRKTVLSTPNLIIPASDINSAIPHLQQQLNCPVELERDVNLQLAFDIHHLQATDKTVLGVYLGTGVGFSIWLNGDIYTGAHGVAGELGHIPFRNNNKVCGCGSTGCLETEVSGIRLKQEFEQRKHDYQLSDFFLQKQNQAFTNKFISDMSEAIATSVNLFDPEVVVLGGGVIDMKGFPVDKLKSGILSHTGRPLPHDDLRLLQAASSSFNGASGAAIQARRRAL